MDFKLSDGFFDLCINVSDENVTYLKDILSKLYQGKLRVERKNCRNKICPVFSLLYELCFLALVGYRTVALNQNLDESVFDVDKKKKKKGEENKEVSNIVPNPIDVSKLNEEFKGKLCIVNRITFSCSDPIKTHTLVWSNINNISILISLF